MKNYVYWVVLLGGILLLGGCTTLPKPPLLEEVHALPPAQSGVMSEVSIQFARDHAGDESGFLNLSNSEEALNYRLALIDEATTSIDAQYFIWQNDEVGILLFNRLLNAADRGVKVRLLVDDMVFAPKDRTVAALTLHHNVDIKIFNPGNVRNSTLGSMFDFVANFKRLNRRMHNKLLVVDNQIAVVGGRNIGNAYFGLSKKYNFRDLDVLVVGAVLPELSLAFDTYWNNDLSYPGGTMSIDATIEDIDHLRTEIESYLEENSQYLTSYLLLPSVLRERLKRLPELLVAGKAHFLQDEPVLIGGDKYRLLDMLEYVSQPSQQELIVVSPYLIPTDAFLENIHQRVLAGVRVKILTPSLGANNHTAAHSHYKKYRKTFLKNGVQLYEMKHDLPDKVRDVSDVYPVQSKFTCLHIKSMVADRKRCFVGSLNIDPRALELNTENGLYIESPELCGALADQFDALMSPETAWRVLVNEDNQLRWESDEGTVSNQPARGFGQRIGDFFFRIIPMESQL